MMMITIHSESRPKGDINLLYIPEKERGKRLMQVEGAFINY